MSLRERLRERETDTSTLLFLRYGVTRNPFPSAGQPSGHPHMTTGADQEIENRLVAFERDHNSEVLVVEGTQGVGKTNLLNYYQEELEDLYRGDKGAYIIRYYPDPEPSFEGVLRRIFQELGERYLLRLGEALASLSEEEQNRILQRVVRTHESRCVLAALVNAKEEIRPEVAQLALEWLVGLRIVNRHRDVLGISFRLDTVESKTQALRDMVESSIEANCLKGIFLLLDELEKQDLALSKTIVLRYLLAIRALVDALPRNFFLMVAVTPEAKRRYFEMVPAFQGRLQNSVSLKPMLENGEALHLYRFYVQETKRSAVSERPDQNAGTNAVLTDAQVTSTFSELKDTSAARGLEGVTHRDFLNALHDLAESAFRQLDSKQPA